MLTTALSSKQAQPVPTLGAHPDESGWFHYPSIHTIADGRLGILRVTIRSLTHTALFLQLISLAAHPMRRFRRVSVMPYSHYITPPTVLTGSYTSLKMGS